MDGEYVFRKATFGGFNREDVMCYISSLKLEINNHEKIKEEAKAAFKEIEDLETKLDQKNKEVLTLKEQNSKLEKDLKDMQQLISKINEQDVDDEASLYEGTADKLMRESMAYAERYVESAGMMAKTIRQDTVEKVIDANQRIQTMLDKVNGLSDKAGDFENLLKSFKENFEEVLENFEEK